ncbi:MAG TPA: cytochrome b N-terminal domain-containing protein [Candidatus Polarisedimenticolia bacterium]|nr:cytochrome b N-terminal domain-containing protein [Candidatus Polarisedimenticolia bacterium]
MSGADPAGGSRGPRPIAWIEQRLNLTEIFSFLTNFGVFPAELDTRKPLREAIHEALDRPIPSYARWPRVLGILSLMLLAVLAVTGVMLAFYYQPTPSEAYESSTILVRDVTFGWFVHQVHGWASHALLFVLLLRLGRFFFQTLYRPPRELIWMVGLLAFLAATHADLTGRLLGWSGQGYWTTVRAVEILYDLPVLGGLFAFVVGGPGIDSLVLTRFYLMHILVLPAALTGLLYLGSAGVRRVGLSGAPEGGAGRAAYAVYLHDLMILALLTVGALVTLATLLPAPFDQPADPLVTPRGARPPWYLLASYGFMEAFPGWFPRWARGLLVEAALVCALLLPFLDRPGKEGRRVRTARILAAAAIAAWLTFTWYGWRLEAGP